MKTRMCTSAIYIPCGANLLSGIIEMFLVFGIETKVQGRSWHWITEY